MRQTRRDGDPGAPEDAGEAGSFASLTEKAYFLLRQDILWGKLAPDSHLKIEDVRRHYGIGPTPLREALSRLVAEGLVISETHRGFSIPTATVEDLRDIVRQRKLLECEALERAIENGGEEWEARVVAAYHRMTRVEQRGLAEGTNPWAEWELRHREFHEALISGAGSNWSQRLLRLLYDQGDRYRRLYRAEVFITPVIQGDHQRILDATLARAGKLAAREMAGHVERLNDGAAASAYFGARET